MYKSAGHISIASFFKMVAQASVKFLLAMFFVFIFLVQSFSGLAYIQNNSRNTDQDFNILRSQPFTDLNLFTQNPGHSKNNLQYLDAEFQINEEDEIQENSEGSSYSNLSQDYHIEGILFTSRLNIQYVRISNSIQKRSKLPLFILHHNWKNYIS